jgi:hypothetical protein
MNNTTLSGWSMPLGLLGLGLMAAPYHHWACPCGSGGLNDLVFAVLSHLCLPIGAVWCIARGVASFRGRAVHSSN